MHSATTENYIKAIYELCRQSRESLATTGRLARKLNVSPGTVTTMLKGLDEGGLATHTPFKGATLTRAGRALALRVLRRHRLIETFLVEVLKLTWDEVHDEAERMEHAVSDLLIERIDAYLGFPERDPHGDPIPGPDGRLRTSEALPMTELAVGSKFRLDRVRDQSGSFLRYLADNGLQVGRVGRVAEVDDEAGTVKLRLQRRTIVLAASTAKKLLVSVPGPGES